MDQEAPTTTTTTPTETTVQFTAEHLVIPEGLSLHDAERDGLLQILNGGKAPNEMVSDMLALAAARTKEATAAAEAEMARERESWKQMVAQEFGPKFESTRAAVAQVIAECGDADLQAVLDQSGLGDHPALFRFAAKISALLAEGKPAPTAKASPTGPQTIADAAMQLFGKGA